MKPWRLALLGPLLWLSACAGPRALSDGPPPAGDIPAPLRSDAAADEIKDAVPRAEPRSKYGNPPSYSVYGKTYYVLASAENFRERGRASWYGRKFHGRRTSSGEPYDMYAMTAAHRTLPFGTRLRVTNPRTGASVVVRINDRGPFHGSRIIDVSRAAAEELGLVGRGHGLVELALVD